MFWRVFGSLEDFEEDVVVFFGFVVLKFDSCILSMIIKSINHSFNQSIVVLSSFNHVSYPWLLKFADWWRPRLLGAPEIFTLFTPPERARVKCVAGRVIALSLPSLGLILLLLLTFD